MKTAFLKAAGRAARKLRKGVRNRWSALRAGTWPYPIFYARRHWKTRLPETYMAKLQYKMLRDRRPILRLFADKVAVREYIADRLGPGYLTEAYAVVSDAGQIDWSALPREYVCKPSHSWDRAVVVYEQASVDATLPSWAEEGGSGMHVLHPDRVNTKVVTARLNAWLRERHGWGPGSAWEWCYRDIPPRILVEELLTDEDGRLPDDLKCWVINGRLQAMRCLTRWRNGERIKVEGITCPTR